MSNLITSIILYFIRIGCIILQLRFVEFFFGKDFTGLTALLNQVCLYVSLIELGLGEATLSLLYEPLKKNNFETIVGLLNEYKRSIVKTLSIGTPFTVAGLYIISIYTKTSLPWYVIFNSSVLIAISIFLSIYSFHYQSYLNATGKLKLLNITFMLSNVIKTLLGITASYIFACYYFLPAAYLIGSIVEYILILYFFKKNSPIEIKKLLASTKYCSHAAWKRSKYVLLHKIGCLVYYQSNFVILGFVSSLKDVSFFSKYQYLYAGAFGICTAISSACTTPVAKRLADNISLRKQQYIYLSTIIMVLAGWYAFSFFLFYNKAQIILFGSTEKNTYLLILMSILLFLNIIKLIDDALILVTGSFQIGYFFPILESVIYLIFGITLVHYYGLCGIPLAGIITYVIISYFARLKYYERAFLSTGMKHLFLSRFLYLITISLFALSIYYLGFYFDLSLFKSIIIAILTGSICLILSYIFYKKIHQIELDFNNC